MSNKKKYNKSLTNNKHYYKLGGIEVTPNMLTGSSGNGIIPKPNLNLPTERIFPIQSSTNEPSKLSQFLKSDGFKQISNIGIGMAGTAIGGALSGGMSSGIGNTMGQIGGLVGQVNPIAGAAINVAGGLFNRAFGSKMNDANIATVENRINQLNNFQSDANSFDTLSDTWGSTALGTNFNNSYIGKDGWFSNKARNKANSLREQQNAANAYVINTLQNNANNLIDEQMSNLEANYAAFGGTLNTQGTNFPTGLSIINTGGTHENNPYEGVPMGIAPDGNPNLVEEGEAVYNNYVFSNRLTVPKVVKDKYKLKGKKDLTFADAVKQLSKNIEERPNDTISKDTLDESLNTLAQIQELLRAEKETKQYAKGGCLHKHDDGGVNTYAAQSNYTLPNNGVSGKPLDDKYQTWDDFTDYNGNPLWVRGNYIDDYSSKGFKDFARNFYNTDSYNMYFNENTMPNYFKNNSSLADFDTAWNLGHDGNYGDYHKVFANLYNMYLADKEKPNVPTPNNSNTSGTPNNPNNPNTTNTPNNSNNPNNPNNQEIKHSPEWLRFIPAAGLGVAAVTDALGLTNKPDYSAANSIEAAYNQGSYKPVRYTPIGNYLTYNPIDRERMINRLNATSSANRRALANQSGGNSGKTIAGLLASDYNALNQLGQAIISTDEYNNKQRQAVEEFNRQTNIQNSQGRLQADMANQQAYNNNRQAYLQGITQAANLRQQAKQLSDKAKSANLSGLLQSLGDIGYENKNMNMIRGLYASGVIAPMTDDIAAAFNLIKNNKRNKNNKSSNKNNSKTK